VLSALLARDTYRVGKPRSCCDSYARHTCQVEVKEYLKQRQVSKWAVCVTSNKRSAFLLSSHCCFSFLNGIDKRFLLLLLPPFPAKGQTRHDAPVFGGGAESHPTVLGLTLMCLAPRQDKRPAAGGKLITRSKLLTKTQGKTISSVGQWHSTRPPRSWAGSIYV